MMHIVNLSSLCAQLDLHINLYFQFWFVHAFASTISYLIFANAQGTLNYFWKMHKITLFSSWEHVHSFARIRLNNLKWRIYRFCRKLIFQFISWEVEENSHQPSQKKIVMFCLSFASEKKILTKKTSIKFN